MKVQHLQQALARGSYRQSSISSFGSLVLGRGKGLI